MKVVSKLLAGLILVAAIAGGGWYFFNKGKQEFVIKPGEKLSEEQVSRLVQRVGRFLVLPDNEEPSVAAIVDAAALAERQSFYQGAKDGDILLVYSNKAIIYDAVEDKLVNVGPIVRTDEPVAPVASGSGTPLPEASATPAPEPTEPVTIEVRNGTTTAGLAGAMRDELKKNELFNVTSVGDATGSYTETFIVDLTGGKKFATVQALQQELKTAKLVTALPQGERSTTAEVLVLIGK
ncbi:MAG TPA: LytR C-terminal domain-containing protein [Candidatus Paceibacterota bacterium]|nr:LytR C-terminal domain-containing protein [Candidatus Paceibacterota bacterium]